MMDAYYQKCNGCNCRDETTYFRVKYDDVYCDECFTQIQIDDECYCDEDNGLFCRHHYPSLNGRC